MRSNPIRWDPSPWGLAYGLGVAAGCWLSLNGYAHTTVVACVVVAGFVQLSELHRQAFIEDFKAALRDTNLDQCEAAHAMKLDPSDLGKMLRGDQRFDVWRLEMLPDETRCCFYFRRSHRLGLPAFVRSAMKMAPAFDVKEIA